MGFLQKIKLRKQHSVESQPGDKTSLSSQPVEMTGLPDDSGVDVAESEGDVGQSLYQSGEGRVFLLGLFLSLIFIGLVAYYLSIDIKIGQTLLLAFVAHTFGGRAAGIGLCIAFNFSSWVTIGYNLFLEVLIVCYCYSLFVFSFRNYINLKWLTTATKNAERQALKHKDVVARYGWLGIFTFVMIPLPITGPAAGSIIAYFLKFSIKRNFSAVFSGTLASIIIWTYFFDYLEQHIAIFKYAVVAVILVVFLSYFKTIKRWFTQEIDVEGDE
jgi:uncharacterized membrane protein